ncbi:hypothetical protein [Luteimonas deserti]|uniref:Uncharacterized protein n=1 Tax=Luteimonas deserti TaxID=2752306 RepID=A0A7Z0QQG4_9GAMM|nr:hypothetical protein [Luteimonas deserti]NYZ62071.1 hypothetical protein [Luteimonas deserti]
MTIRNVGAGHGWTWLVQAVNVGRGNPRAVYGAIAIVSLLALLPSLVQVVMQTAFGFDAQTQLAVIGATSLVSILVYPLLIGGVLRVIDAVERGRPARAADVFRTFSAEGGAGRLVGFGVLMGALYILTFYALVSLFGEGVPEWYLEVMTLSQEMGNAGASPATPPELPMPPAGIGLLMALGLMFGIYYATVYAIGLGQVALGGRRVTAALRDGLVGALRNVLPVMVVAAIAMAGVFALMLVFGILVVMITVVASLVHPALAGVLLLPLYLALLLVLYIVMFGVMYAMWRDICAPPGDEAGTPPMSGQIEL